MWFGDKSCLKKTRWHHWHMVVCLNSFPFLIFICNWSICISLPHVHTPLLICAPPPLLPVHTSLCPKAFVRAPLGPVRTPLELVRAPLESMHALLGSVRAPFRSMRAQSKSVHASLGNICTLFRYVCTSFWLVCILFCRSCLPSSSGRPLLALPPPMEIHLTFAYVISTYSYNREYNIKQILACNYVFTRTRLIFKRHVFPFVRPSVCHVLIGHLLSRAYKNKMLNIQSNTCHNSKQHKQSRDTIEITITA
jgi:hypothetical protein